MTIVRMMKTGSYLMNPNFVIPSGARNPYSSDEPWWQQGCFASLSMTLLFMR
jgi:hypothetical protein